MRMCILCVVTVLMAMFSCVRTTHDLDPALRPFLFEPGTETFFTDAIPDAHRVCVSTHQYLAPQVCMTLGEIRRHLAAQRNGL